MLLCMTQHPGHTMLLVSFFAHSIYCGGRADANFQVVLGRRQRTVKSEAAKGAGPFRGSLPARRSRRAAQAAHRERRQVGAQGTPQSQTMTRLLTLTIV